MVFFLRIIHDINTRRSEDGFSKRGKKVLEGKIMSSILEHVQREILWTL